jgi:formylglycine-generating enzyme required for sulfatase activity
LSASAVRSDIRHELIRARSITDALFEQVVPEAMYDRPIPERHRLLFYLGHLEAFDWNLVGRDALGLGWVIQELDQLFAFGIDPPPGQLPQDEPADWPALGEAAEYLRRVRRRLDPELASAPDEALHMAVEHRLMHAETLTYLLHNLPYSRRLARPVRADRSAESPALQMIAIPGGPATLGLRRGGDFGWDNEFERHTRWVPGFRISKYKITNAQYLEFVKAGGTPPHYWSNRAGEWFYRGLNTEMPLPADYPVYVSHAQAQAYAGWMGKSLPTEEQYHRAAFGTHEGVERAYPWGNDLPDARHGNFDFLQNDLLPVTATPAGNSAFGVSQLLGNGWEWTSTVFAPFSGFAPNPSYPGYSADFYDGDHYVLKGGSCVTDSLLLRPSFRNWFRDHYPYGYTTFRIVEN